MVPDQHQTTASLSTYLSAGKPASKSGAASLSAGKPASKSGATSPYTLMALLFPSQRSVIRCFQYLSWLLVLAWVGLCCMLNCSSTVDAADAAALFQNFNVVCNTRMAISFSSPESVIGCFQGFLWSSSPTLDFVARCTVHAWWWSLTKHPSFGTLPSLVTHK